MSSESEKQQNFYWSKLIDNKSSTARDHLANERTYLAWFRTSMTLVMIGVALNQLSTHTAQPNDQKKMEPLIMSISLIVSGIIILIFGLFRFLNIENTLVTGKFILSRIPIISTIIASMLILCLIILVFLNDVLPTS